MTGSRPDGGRSAWSGYDGHAPRPDVHRAELEFMKPSTIFKRVAERGPRLGEMRDSPEIGDPQPQVEEYAMVMRRVLVAVLVAGGSVGLTARDCAAQCCLDGLFAGCGSCFRKAPPAYAVAPVMAQLPAQLPAPPPPVMVPVQQVSYVPETTYQTKYECVPVTSYKP